MLLMLLIGGVCKLLIYMNLLNLLMLPHTPWTLNRFGANRKREDVRVDTGGRAHTLYEGV
jgi:hypothetical protein